jgi:hypothetical protein
MSNHLLSAAHTKRVGVLTNSLEPAPTQVHAPVCIPCVYCAEKFTDRAVLKDHIPTCSKRPVSTTDDEIADEIARKNGFSNHIHQDLNIDIEDQNKIFQIIVKEQHKKNMELTRILKFVHGIIGSYLAKEAAEESEEREDQERP